VIHLRNIPNLGICFARWCFNRKSPSKTKFCF